MNLLCGVIGVIFTFKGRFDIAFYFMLAAAVFDFCDGLTARLLNAHSPLGKELDSLSDMVSFGVLPSLMLVEIMMAKTGFDSALCYIPVILAVFSGLRLGKFNIDTRQTLNFIGLPTPASAMLCGALACFIAAEPSSFLAVWASGYVFIPVLAIILSLLLVSEIPMFSMKIKKEGVDAVTKMKRIALLSSMVICIVITFVLHINWTMVIILLFSFYILMNIAFLLVPQKK